MTIFTALGLFAAALGAGALNSIAGGGQFLTFPMLLFAGVPAVQANATSSVAVWPGTVAATVGYRQELAEHRRLLLPLGLASVVGGVVGAIILLRTPPATFTALVPWLLLLSTLLLIGGGPITQRLRRRLNHEGPLSSGAISGLVVLQVLLGMYGGYFGGGMGFVILAALALVGFTNLHTMNGLKTALASCINGVAVATFIIAGAVVWSAGLIMLVGAIIGGYGGAHYARKLPPQRVRYLTIAIACTMTTYFFVRQYWR